MENASKALLLAGSLLITLVIISMLVLVINSLTSYQSINDSGNKVDELASFNAQYEAYNRDDVRGNDLFTLANKVIDYNRRKTASGAKNTDVGDTIGYNPITLKVDLKGHKEELRAPEASKNLLFDGSTDVYETSGGTRNDLDDKFKIISDLESKYPTEALNRLATSYTKIFIHPEYEITDDQEKEAKINAIKNFNICYGSDILRTNDSAIDYSWGMINGGSMIIYVNGKRTSINIKNDVQQYYEFVQFKRGRFKCTSVTRDNNGRITGLNFEFTGVLN